MEYFKYADSYKGLIRKKKLFLLILFILLISVSLLSINVGSSDMTVIESLKVIFGVGDEKARHIVFSIRMPRIVGGILVGINLGISGMLIQTVMNNPLASPSTLGITNASTFGANVGLILLARMGMESSFLVSISSFAAAFFCMSLVISATKIIKNSKTSIILAGVAFGSLFSAGTTIIQYFADDTEIAGAVFWTFGDLSRLIYPKIRLIAIPTIISVFLFYKLSWQLNAMDQGEETAHSLGVNVKKLRNLAILLAALNTGVSVAFVGMIGFVGLLAPQISKRIIGQDKRYMIPSTMLMGALITVFSDTVARTVLSPVVLPVGAVTAFLGAPLFIYILLKGEGER